MNGRPNFLARLFQRVLPEAPQAVSNGLDNHRSAQARAAGETDLGSIEGLVQKGVRKADAELMNPTFRVEIRMTPPPDPTDNTNLKIIEQATVVAEMPGHRRELCTVEAEYYYDGLYREYHDDDPMLYAI